MVTVRLRQHTHHVKFSYLQAIHPVVLLLAPDNPRKLLRVRYCEQKNKTALPYTISKIIKGLMGFCTLSFGTNLESGEDCLKGEKNGDQGTRASV
jgi:hypothetical protein